MSVPNFAYVLPDPRSSSCCPGLVSCTNIRRSYIERRYTVIWRFQALTTEEAGGHKFLKTRI